MAKRVRRARVQDIMLRTLYGATFLSMAILAPKAVEALKIFDPFVHKKRKPVDRITQALSRLEVRGLVARDKAGRYGLTEKGEHKAALLHAKEKLKMHRPRKWDERWRLIIFDVWEKRRIARDRLRLLLEEVGFVRLQDSVWVFPYDCEDVIALVKTELRLGGGSVLYIVAEEIENDSKLRGHFRLP